MKKAGMVLMVAGLNIGLAMAATPTLSEFSAWSDEQKVAFLDQEATLLQESADLKPHAESEAVQAMVSAMAHELSNIWPDTILEGPYAMNGDATGKLTGVYLVDGEVYAYSGMVSSSGYFIDGPECVLDEEKDEWTNCPEVTLYQHFYMDSSGKFIESENYPEAD